LSDEQRTPAEKTQEATIARLKAVATPWFKFFFLHDPATSLRRVTCPVLGLYGELDLQVDPDQNLGVARLALQAGGNMDVTLVEFPKLNHLFQTAQTGLPGEYGVIEETIAPDALDLIRDWIVERTS